MPTFELEAPDGKKYRVEAPEGATYEDAIEKLREQQISQREEEPWYEDFAEGVGLSGLETYYGIKGLFTDLEKEEEARLEDWRQDAGQSKWGTGGQIAGEIGQMLIPAGAATKGLRLAAAAKRGGDLGRLGLGLTRAGAEVGTAAGFGALQAPDVGETRGGNAATMGAGAVAGEGAGYLLGKAARGLAKTPQAERLLSRGVDLTPGQAAENNVARGVEGILDVLPLVAPTVRKARGEATEQMHEVALDAATAPGKTVTKKGTEGIAELKQGFNEAYGEAWSGATSMSNAARKSFVDTAVDGAKSASKKQRRELKTVLEDFKELTKDVTPQKYREMDNVLRKRISAAKKDYDYQQLLIDMRTQLRSGAPDGVMDSLAAVDQQYGKYLVVRQAAKNAADEGGEFAPNHLVRAVKSVGKEQAGEGTAPMQSMMVDMAKVAKRAEDPAPLETWRRLAGLGFAIPGAKQAGRAVLGQTRPQKAVAGALDQIPEYLRGPGIAGAASTEGDDQWWRYWK